MDELEELLIKKYRVPPDKAKAAAASIVQRGKAESVAAMADEEAFGSRKAASPDLKRRDWPFEGQPWDAHPPAGIMAAANNTDSSYYRQRYPASVLESEALARVAANATQQMRRLKMFTDVYSPKHQDMRNTIPYGTDSAFQRYPEHLVNYEAIMGKPRGGSRPAEGVLRSQALQTVHDLMRAKSGER